MQLKLLAKQWGIEVGLMSRALLIKPSNLAVASNNDWYERTNVLLAFSVKHEDSWQQGWPVVEVWLHRTLAGRHCYVRLSQSARHHARLAISIRRRRTGPPQSGIRMMMTPGSILDYRDRKLCRYLSWETEYYRCCHTKPHNTSLVVTKSYVGLWVLG